MPIRILNLYAGLGGNRKLWGDGYEVTAVENDPEIARAYQDNFPDDTVVVADAHAYLLEHFAEFDIIWSSPPCQTHSSMRYNLAVRFRGTKPAFPDMTLYEEIVFLKYHATGLWVVENVKPYYPPLVAGQLIQRHMFWSNFDIPNIKLAQDKLRTAQIPELEARYGFDLSGYKIPNKRQILRNCVEPELGLHVLREGIKCL
jgi:DNA (cytosine-5)-methyltransferase 1